MKYSSAITVTQSCGDLTRLPFSRGFGHSAMIIFDSSLNLTLSEEFDKRFKKGIRRYVRVSLIMSRGCINKCGVSGSINLGAKLLLRIQSGEARTLRSRGATGGFSRPVPPANKTRRGKQLMQTYERLGRALRSTHFRLPCAYQSELI